MGNGRRVSGGERAIGLVLLAVLVALGVFLVTRGPYYAPQDVALPAGERPGAEGAKGAPSAPAAGELLPREIPEVDWVREGDVEVYTEDRLYEKINGADQRYRDYGNVQLVFALYAPETGGDSRLEVFSYEMRTPLAALGIFGREQSPGAVIDQDLGEAGYFIGSSAFFRKGCYYVQIKGFDEDAREACEKLARYLAETVPGEPAPETAFAFLPQEGRVPGSERFEPKDRVLGTDFLENVFSAEYVSADAVNPQPVILFAVHCGDEEGARLAVDQYREHLGRQVKLLGVAEIEGVTATLMDLDGLFEGFWAEGEVFAGVAEAPDQTALRKYATSLILTLRAGVVPRIEEGSPAAPPGG
jgi:hypothetical protein